MKEKVFLDLRDKIMKLEYKPGTLLNETNLANEYNVSRTIIREVLRGLKDYGFVEIIPRGGTYVSEINLKEFRDIFEIKSELEGLAAELVLERINEEQKQEFTELIQKIQNTFTTEIKHGDLIEFDEKFHQIMREACGNKEVARILESYHIRCTRLWYYVSTDITDEIFVEDYLNFFELGIKQQNIEGAKNIMKKHTDKFVELIKSKIL